MTTTTFEPGVSFDARDGNDNPVTAVIPLPDEDTEYVLDASGERLRTGDWVLVLEDRNWHGRICLVEKITRGTVYSYRSGRGGVIVGAWAPQGPLNRVDLVSRGTRHTSTRPHLVQKVSLTESDKIRLDLVALHDKRAALNERMARTQEEMVAVSLQIAQLIERESHLPGVPS